uniref:Uncharacterized protein n=1 Tax=Rhizophora mucronata TaxID=61149 RepID=A0A2P2QM40_RHIMU
MLSNSLCCMEYEFRNLSSESSCMMNEALLERAKNSAPKFLFFLLPGAYQYVCLLFVCINEFEGKIIPYLFAASHELDLIV